MRRTPISAVGDRYPNTQEALLQHVEKNTRDGTTLSALISEGRRRVVLSAGVATATTTSAAPTATTTSAATAPAAATTTSAAALTAATPTCATTTPARTAATCATARTTGGAGHHGIGSRAKAVIRGTAKGVKDSYNNEGNSDYKEGILGGILPGLLSPEPFKGRQHGNTFISEGTTT